MPQRRLFLSRGGVKVVEIIFWVLWVLWTTIPATVQSQVVSDQFTCSSSLTGVMSNDLAGWEAAMVGDVNGDGFGDLLIAAPATNNGSTRSGTVYLIFGTSNLPPLLTSLSTADVTFLGAKVADEVGKKVAGVGDVNGDGYADFVIAAPMANGGAGAANLIFGKSTGWPKQFALDDANAIFAGEKPGDNAGIAVAAAGDVNGDGLNDFIIGAPHSNPQDSDKGKAYLILGKRGGWAKNVALASADVTLVGETDRDLFGLSVAGVGDVDQDGVADIAIGAPYYDLPGTRDAGKVYLFTGKAMAAGAKIPAATASATLIGSQPGDFLGRHISGAGDINGDEIADFTVTALLGNSSGKIYLLFGNALGWGQQTPVDGFAPSFGGEQAGDCAGVPVFLADWNQDGFSDLLIGAARNSKSAAQAGAVYLIPGKATGWTRNSSLSQATVVLRGEKEQDNAGQSLTSGDFDGDGWLELAVGLPGSDAAALNAGMVNLISCPFKPKPASLTLVTPNGGENWQVGSVHPITWASTGRIENVRLYYSIDNGVNWKTIVNSTPNDGRFDWTIPNDPSAACLVQIEAANDGEPSDRSDQVFTISPLPIPVTLTITAPNGGEQWLVGSQHQITWNWSGALAQVKIEYSINNGMTWNLIDPGAANDGSYDWTIPEAPSNFCLVRVSDTIDGQPVDMSDAVFSIVLPAEAITLIAPNGGECWHSGSTQEIKWHATGPISFVKIQYSIDGGNNWITIVSSTANDGSYLWTLPAVHSQNCYVKVADVDCNPEDVSDHPFTIWNRTPITLISPNGGECLAAEQKWEIKWEACCCLDSVKIQYSTDGGIDWTMIVFGTEKNGSYLWTVPKTHSDKCLVKVADLDCDPFDVSDQPFTIWNRAPITVLAPNGGECFKVGEQAEIKWTAACYLDSLKIQYSTDNGTTWINIVYGTPNDGSYLWTVPNINSDNCLIKVADLDCEPFDVSDKPFAICSPPYITVLQPNGNECLLAGSPYPIKWQACCFIDSVKIQFSNDNGKNWTNIVATTENDGIFAWTVPPVLSDSCLIKVADVDGDPVDVSDKAFAIKPLPTWQVVQPNGGEILSAGANFEIRWTSCGYQIDTVKIQYSTDGGKNWLSIIYRTANDGSYTWKIPNTPSDSCLVKVADVDCEPTDVSDGFFAIKTAAVANFDATIMTGAQPLEVQFVNLSSENAIDWQWNFGDGSRSNERAPVHIYNRPGNYAVQLIARFPSQIDSITRVDFIRVHSPETYAQLQLADASPTLPQQDGGNATDGDMYGWDGTTVLEGHQPYLIFSVVNGLNRKISGFGLIADTGIGYEERWIHRFQVQISTAGSEANEFQVVLDTVMTTGGFEIFTINPIQANFVKLQVVEPPAGPTHLGEFQVYLTDAEPATVAKELQPMPGKFSLEQNYPNPFNPTTMIRFQLAQATVVRLEIYTVLGTAIRMLVTGPMAAGIHELRWDGKNSDGEAVPSGVYLAVLTAYGRQEVRKLVLAK